MVSWPNFNKLARINLSISRPSHLSQWWLRPGCSLRVTTRGTSWPGPSWRRRYCWPYCPWRPPGSCPWTPQCWGWGRRQCHTGSPVTRLPSPGSHSVLYCDDHILFAFVEGKVSMSVLPISAKQTLVVDQRSEHFSWQLTIFVFYLRKGGIQEQSHYCSSVSVWTGLWKEIAKKKVIMEVKTVKTRKSKEWCKIFPKSAPFWNQTVSSITWWWAQRVLNFDLICARGGRSKRAPIKPFLPILSVYTPQS